MADTDTNQSTPPFDLQGLKDLYGADTVSELLAMSVDEARGLLVAIGQGIAGQDSRAVMEAAHQLKGLASTMTINEMASISLQLETSARQERWDLIPEAQGRLEQEFKNVARYIQSILSAPS